MIFLNLSNGIEYLDNRDIENYAFVRIQSTACEQKRWGFILQDLDYNFLMQLALGETCIVVDYSAHKTCSRAIYQGLEWIKFVLNIVWFDKEYIPFVNGCNCKSYFDSEYKKLDRKTIKRIGYFKKFLLCEQITLVGTRNNTVHDSDNEYYKNILKENRNGYNR